MDGAAGGWGAGQGQRGRERRAQVVAGQTAAVALKKVKRGAVRKGMVLLDERLKPAAAWEFDAEIAILTHSTTIAPKYQVGSLRSSGSGRVVLRGSRERAPSSTDTVQVRLRQLVLAACSPSCCTAVASPSERPAMLLPFLVRAEGSLLVAAGSYGGCCGCECGHDRSPSAAEGAVRGGPPQAVIHCEIVRQAARVVAMDRERLRSGDRAHVRFRFLQVPPASLPRHPPSHANM